MKRSEKMPLFRYLAVNKQGKKIKGVVDADSFLLAKEKLRKQQILVTEVVELKRNKKEISLPRSVLFAFTRDLAQLLKAGLPLYESLVTVEEKHQEHPSHALFLDLCDRLKSGFSFSAALKRYPKTFDPLYLAMIQVAEQSGELALAFEQLTQLMIRQQKLKKQFISAVAYPAFLAFFCLLIVGGLLFFAIPSMQELFEGRALHPTTLLVLSMSRFANEHSLFLGLIGCALLSGLIFLLKSMTGRKLLSQLSFKLPLIQKLLLHAALVRFCRALFMLLNGGVSLLEALKLARHVVMSPLFEEAITQIETQVMQGESLSKAFGKTQLVPSLVGRMVSFAEETGKLGEAFTNLAEVYEEEMERHLSQLNTFLQPVLLITLGAIVGLVVLSILLPLTDMSSFTMK